MFYMFVGIECIELFFLDEVCVLFLGYLLVVKKVLMLDDF